MIPINIFLRETSNIKIHNDRPNWFNYEKCFISLLKSIYNPCKLNIIFDGDFKDHYILKYKEKFDYNIIKIQAGNDFSSNTKTFEYIKTLNIESNELIAVFENDYLYRPDWIMNLIWFIEYLMESKIIDFNSCYFSLFDHLDKYIYNEPNSQNEWGIYKDLKSQIYLGLNGYWRTTPSTCGSFLLTKELFDKDYDIHTNGTADNTRFHELTTKRNRMVLSPMPGLATHCNKYFMSPFIDWKAINDKINL